MRRKSSSLVTKVNWQHVVHQTCSFDFCPAALPPRSVRAGQIPYTVPHISLVHPRQMTYLPPTRATYSWWAACLMSPRLRCNKPPAPRLTLIATYHLRKLFHYTGRTYLPAMPVLRLICYQVLV